MIRNSSHAIQNFMSGPLHYLKSSGWIVSFLLLLGACRPLSLLTVDPAGPPGYKLGWEDGCDSGMSAQGGWDYKLMYGFKKRPEMAADTLYKDGWNEGFAYCRFTLVNAQTPGQWESVGLGNGF